MERENFGITKLTDYLKKCPLTGRHNLTSNGSLYFHWSNWKETCELQKKLSGKKSKHSKRLEDLESELEMLKTIPVWINTKRETRRISLYDVYVGYLDPRMREAWFSVHENSLVSLSSSSGPFIALHSMRWLNKEVYEKFIYHKILSSYMPTRSFRLGLDIPAIGYADDSELKEVNLKMHQMTKSGVVFRVSGKGRVGYLLESHSLTLKLNLKPFLYTHNAGIDDVFDYFSNIDFNILNEDELIEVKVDCNIMENYGNVENTRFANGEEYYIFIPYTEMKPQDNSFNLTGLMTGFLEKVENHLLMQIHHDSKNLVA